MCLIVFKRDNKETFAYSDFLTAVENNPDGTGIMYPKDGRVVFRKLGKPTPRDNRDMYEEFIAQPKAALHVRIATHGAKDSDDNAHPFKILDKDKDGVDLYMMHNGMVTTAEIDKNLSDTWHFANMVLRPMLKKSPYTLFNPMTQAIVKKAMGNSRLVFMYGDGAHVIIEDGSGHDSPEYGGVWLSNRYSFTKKYTGYNNPAFGKQDNKEAPKSQEDAEYFYDRPNLKDGVCLPAKVESKDEDDQSWTPKNKSAIDWRTMTTDEKIEHSKTEPIYEDDGWWENGIYLSYTESSHDIAKKQEDNVGKQETLDEYLERNKETGLVTENNGTATKNMGTDTVAESRQLSAIEKFTEASSLDDVLDAVCNLSDPEIEETVFGNPQMAANILAAIRDFYYDEHYIEDYEEDEEDDDELDEIRVPFAMVD